jgi:uncharacterized protein YegL
MTEESNHAASAFDAAEFVDNPEPRCPCVLLVDTSSSMSGEPIRQLNDGLAAFRDELAADALATKRVELAIVGFGPVSVLADFQSPDTFQPPTLVANGNTPMGQAIVTALDMVDQRKATYRSNGVSYYRPWVFLITDGGPTDSWQEAARRIAESEKAGKVSFFAVGVEGANFEVLSKIATRAPLKLQGLRFRDLFSWLSRSLQNVSRSQVGQELKLENPAAPNGWAVIG